MDKNIINHLKSESRWLRLVFMILFATIGYLAGSLAVILSIAQALHGFLQGEPNARLARFTQGLNQFIFQILQFLTYNSDEKPYPFSDWPDQPANDGDISSQ